MLRIVQKALAPGAVAKQIAERHEISTGLLLNSRRQFMVRGPACFVPVRLIRAASDAPPPDPPPSRPPGPIEIDMPNGTRVRAGRGVDLKVLRALSAYSDGKRTAIPTQGGH